MSAAKHTPTPWSTGIYGRISGDHQHLGMHGAVCTFVATCKDPDIGQDRQNWENRETWAPKAEANAAHIVRCVNSHDALVAALEEAHDAIVEGSLLCMERTTGAVLVTSKTYYEGCAKKLNALLAALKAAKEEA
jgi:hypothetical protein